MSAYPQKNVLSEYLALIYDSFQPPSTSQPRYRNLSANPYSRVNPCNSETLFRKTFPVGMQRIHMARNLLTGLPTFTYEEYVVAMKAPFVAIADDDAPSRIT